MEHLLLAIATTSGVCCYGCSPKSKFLPTSGYFDEMEGYADNIEEDDIE